MKNMIYVISVFLIMVSFNIKTALSQDEPTKSIHQAAADGDIEQLKLHVRKGNNVNEKDRTGYTPLQAAILKNQRGSVDFLVLNGADVNAEGPEGQTALYMSVDNNQKDLVEFLISKGANVNAVIRPGENALLLAKQKRYEDIVEVLVKNGAKDPVYTPRSLYPTDEGQGQRSTSMDYEYGTSRDRITAEQEVQLDLLKDPNEIKTRIKTFDGLEKSLTEVEQKSLSEMRQWQMTRADNRIPLLNTLAKQYEVEVGLIRKTAEEEKAQKTTKAIDDMLSVRQERFKKISKELLVQRKEQKQTEQTTRTRGGGRMTGNTTGRYTQPTQTYPGGSAEATYGRRALDDDTNRMENTVDPAQQAQTQAQEEIDLWLGTTTENKEVLANSVQQQIMTEIIAVRAVTVEEKANKTTAAIDGLLLNRQKRFNEIDRKIEEDRQKQERLAQTQEQSGMQQGGRTRGRARGGQWDSMSGQQNQGRTRRR